MRQALQSSWKKLVDEGYPPFRVRDPLDWAVAGPVILRQLSPAHEIVRMRYRRAPVVGKTLEVSEGKTGQILAGAGSDK